MPNVKKKKKKVFLSQPGHFFQLGDEAGVQFIKTMETVRHYTIFEMDHPRDLRSFFWSPPTELVLAEPEDEPPIISGSEENGDAVRAPYKYHGKYFTWKIPVRIVQ
jgi:hypothetical protein